MVASIVIVWVWVGWKVGGMSGSEHSSSIETDLESVEVPLEVTVVVLVKHQRYQCHTVLNPFR